MVSSCPPTTADVDDRGGEKCSENATSGRFLGEFSGLMVPIVSLYIRTMNKKLVAYLRNHQDKFTPITEAYAFKGISVRENSAYSKK